MPSTGAVREGESAQLAPTVGRSAADHIKVLAADLLAGSIVAALNVALAVSFAALLFQGDLKDGFSMGLWSLLMSMAVTTVLVNLMTSIPPISAGPDTPVVAVMTLLGAAVTSQVLALGGSLDLAVRHTLLAFSLMTVLAGVVVYLIGALRWGRFLRFVPYPVVGGFLAATGLLLMMSSYKVITGVPLTIAAVGNAPSAETTTKIAVAITFAVGLLFARARIRASYLMPAAFFGAALAIDFAIWALGGGTDSSAWFIGGIDSLEPWFPFVAAMSPDTNWAVLLRAMPEVVTCVIVGIISVIVKISSLETSRSAAAEIDQEFRANGAASIAAAPLGAVAGSVLVGPSKTFLDAGARTRLSGVATAGVIGLVVLAGIDLPGFIPKPILAGLLLLLGYTMLTDALKGAFNQKSWLEFVLALVIAAVCLQFGYIAGVLAGFICACLIFAFSYGRIGVVRRHLTRASFSGDVERAPEVERMLREDGEAIQVYWLSGYLFFGSSEGLFETIRTAVEAQPGRRVRFVVLDFASVPGMDSSAVVSLVKLRNFCDKGDVTLVYSGLVSTLQDAFERAGLLGKARRHKCFASRNEALDWSEEQLLAGFRSLPHGQEAAADFGQWLSRQLGGKMPPDVAASYFERKQFNGGETLYRQGDAADTIDFVASGALAITLTEGRGPPRRIRRSAQQTVLGEMGFFRALPRGATISADGPALIYTLSRANLEHMQREHPDAYEAFLRFVIRTLSDRLELAHKEAAALI